MASQDGPFSPDPVNIKLNSRSLVLPQIYDALSTISKRWCLKCDPQHTRQAALLLLADKFQTSDTESVAFSVPIRSNRVDGDVSWRHASITITEKSYVCFLVVFIRMLCLEKADNGHRSTRKVRFMAKTSYLPGPKKVPVSDLCKIIDQSKTRLILNVDGDAIFKSPERDLELAEIDLKLPWPDNGRPVTLAESFLSDKQVGLLPKVRISLALVLSYSVFKYFGESPLVNTWDKESIYLIQTSTSVYLIPMFVPETLAADFSCTVSTTAYDLRLLSHAILLLELFTQRSFAVELRTQANLNVEHLRSTVRRLITDIGQDFWDVHVMFRQSVEACVRGTRQMTSESTIDLTDPSVVKAYFSSVVAPLEFEFRALWNSKDAKVEDLIKHIELPSVGPKRPPKPSHLASSSALPARSRWPEVQSLSQALGGNDLSPQLPTARRGLVANFTEMNAELADAGSSEFDFFDTDDDPTDLE